MCKVLSLYVLFIKRQADCFHTVGLLLYYAIDRSAATAAAAQEDQYDNDDPRATSAKTVTHD